MGSSRDSGAPWFRPGLRLVTVDPIRTGVPFLARRAGTWVRTETVFSTWRLAEVIASVRGVVQALRLESAVIEVGGVGLRVHATPATLSTLRVGESVQLSTSFVVREESFTLFGFTDTDELEVFETVQTVSGIGPRTALAMLSVHTPDALRRAVADEDTAALMRVPGIGKKGAARIVLELTDKLGAPSNADGPVHGRVAAVDESEQVVEALVGLGWNLKAAQDSVARVLAARDDVSEPIASADVSEVLRAALKDLGGTRG